ncbi:MAG: electron transfer flavoprotein subunit alpha/FixB family protein [Acidimicrobiia bacterium]|nr:electron transfer flavoprotein subunit alpha/FixB family protein [Acidimicrobiia bacterium]
MRECANILVASRSGSGDGEVPDDTAEVLAAAEALVSRVGGKVGIATPDGATQAECAARLADLCRAGSYDLVLVPHTLWGADVAPRTAGILGWPCATACSDLDAEEEGWTFKRRLHGGALVGTVRTGPAPCVISLETSQPTRTDSGDSLLTAARVVAGGRGVGGPGGFGKLAVLAEALGAALASSRPPCDAGWVPSALQVGITGAQVKPELYVAVGISGSVQHLAGMHRAKCIVAVNTDPDAAIFRYAHLGVVGEWTEVVAGMLDRLPDESAEAQC